MVKPRVVGCRLDGDGLRLIATRRLGCGVATASLLVAFGGQSGDLDV
jgi:hypothetical protein